MMKIGESDQSLFEEVPSSIICDILSRLPTKSCLNCKLVCKEWYQTVKCPEFFELRRSRGSYSTLLLYGKFYNLTTNFLLLDLDKDSNVDETGNVSVGVDAMIRFKSEYDIPNKRLHLVNECNGVICLKAQEMWGPFVVCNPLTGQYMIVEQSRKPFHSVQGYGLGCCPVSRQFKVLRILMTQFKYVAEILTLGTGEWRTVGDAPICKERIGAFMQGSLHWYSSRDHDICSFHFGSEQFSRVPLPDDTKGNNAPDVIVFDSYLCFGCISKDGWQRDIWLMKEYGMKDSWVKQLVMERGEFGLHYVPLLRMGSGEILVSFRGRCNLLAYDQRSEAYKRVRVHGVSSFDVVACDMKLSEL